VTGLISFPAKFFSQITARRQESIAVFGPEIKVQQGQPDFFLAMEAEKIGAYSRLLGMEREAAEYFGHAARLYWPHNLGRVPGQSDDHLTIGQLFCSGGVCAALAGQPDRAMQLFEWCQAEYDRIAPEDLAVWQPGGRHETHRYGELMLFRAYAELRTGRWEQVAQRAAAATQSFTQAQRRKGAVQPHYAALARALAAAAAFHEQPSENALVFAQQALVRVVTQADTFIAQAAACLNVWDLRAAVPDVFGAVTIQGN
jgi:hypothetical protein